MSDQPRIALRPDDPKDWQADGENRMVPLDDIYVTDVECFRAEQMDAGVWWLRCYLTGGGTIDFDMRRRSSPARLEMVCNDLDVPEGTTFETRADIDRAVATGGDPMSAQLHCGHWLRRDDSGAWIDQCCRCDATWAAWDGKPDEPCLPEDTR